MPTANNPSEPPRKDERIELRLDPDFAQQVKDKARLRGWSVGSVARALLARWLKEDIISGADVGEQTGWAPRKRRKPKRRQARQVTKEKLKR